jgi:hypothetical protein
LIVIASYRYGLEAAGKMRYVVAKSGKLSRVCFAWRIKDIPGDHNSIHGLHDVSQFGFKQGLVFCCMSRSKVKVRQMQQSACTSRTHSRPLSQNLVKCSAAMGPMEVTSAWPAMRGMFKFMPKRFDLIKRSECTGTGGRPEDNTWPFGSRMKGDREGWNRVEYLKVPLTPCLLGN